MARRWPTGRTKTNNKYGVSHVWASSLPGLRRSTSFAALRSRTSNEAVADNERAPRGILASLTATCAMRSVRLSRTTEPQSIIGNFTCQSLQTRRDLLVSVLLVDIFWISYSLRPSDCPHWLSDILEFLVIFLCALFTILCEIVLINFTHGKVNISDKKTENTDLDQYTRHTDLLSLSLPSGQAGMSTRRKLGE